MPVRRLVLRIAFGVVVSVAAVYLLDWAVLRGRMAAGQNVYGSVTVQQYYAVPQKNGKYEFIGGDPVTQECVSSLLPHLGDPPCWYATRHPERRIDM